MLSRDNVTCILHLPNLPFSPCPFFLGGFFSTSYIPHIPLCISASVPSKQNHTTHSDLICLSFLLFHKLQRWHSGVSVAPWDGVLDVLEGVTTKAVQSTRITPSATVIVKCFWLICTDITEFNWWVTTVLHEYIFLGFFFFFVGTLKRLFVLSKTEEPIRDFLVGGM